MKNVMHMAGNATIAVLIWIVVTLTLAGAWTTHVITCLTDDRWGFLIAGAILFPIAIVHGVMIWFGLA